MAAKSEPFVEATTYTVQNSLLQTHPNQSNVPDSTKFKLCESFDLSQIRGDRFSEKLRFGMDPRATKQIRGLQPAAEPRVKNFSRTAEHANCKPPFYLNLANYSKRVSWVSYLFFSVCAPRCRRV